MPSNKYHPSELLYILYPNFCDDFSVADVRHELKREEILTTEEINEILAESTPEIQIDKLFFILIYKNKDVEHFMRVIHNTYDWITDEWNRIRKDSYNDSSIDFYRECLRNSEIPKNRDSLVHRLKYLWMVQKNLKNLKCGEYLILHGKANFGKRWIACDSVINYAIVKQMNYKIFWVNLQKCETSEMILEKLIKLKIMVGESILLSPPTSNYENNTKNQIFHIKKELQKCFNSEKLRDSLLVLSGAQTAETIKAFELNCKIMLTTRFPNIIENIPRELKTEVRIVDGFSSFEAEQYLLKFLPPKIRLKEDEINNIHEVNSLCNGHPFILNLVTVNLTQLLRGSVINIRQERWEEWKKILRDTQDIEGFHSPIQKSLRNLTSEQRNYFESLVIFTNDVCIPIEVLARYWGVEEQIKAEQIIKEFENLALVETEYTSTGHLVCSINYMYYNFLKNDTSLQNRRSHMHRKLVTNYKIEETLASRTEVNLRGFPNDNYFYYYIGFHLKEAEMVELFPKLFLDLGFLELQLRNTRLPNTIGDLELYKDFIINDSHVNFEILMDLIDFLPNVEEMLFKSPNACLLQYAINYDGELKNEALRQAANFKNRIWMQDIDHSDKQRQIIHLPTQPTIICLFDENTAIIGLSNHNIILKDLSSIYSVGPTIYVGHESPIIDMIILDAQQFMSLDSKGVVKIWSVKQTQIECQRQNKNGISLRNVNVVEQVKHSVQEISFDDSKIISMNPMVEYRYDGVMVRLVCFALENRSNRNEIRLYSHLPVDDEKPLQVYQGAFSIEMSRVRRIMEFLDSYYLFVNDKSELLVMSKSDMGRVAITNYDKKCLQNDQPLVNVHFYSRTPDTFKFLIVLAKQIFRCEFRKTPRPKVLEFNFEALFSDINELYDFDRINCTKITNDKKYLILGTNQGCIIYDYGKNAEIFRIQVSEQITSFDTYYLKSSNVYEYMIATCTNKSHEICYLYGLSTSGGYENNNLTQYNNELTLCEKKKLDNVWLVGGRLYDVIYDGNTNDFTLFAVDCEQKIHKRLSSTNFSHSEYVTDKLKHRITAIAVTMTLPSQSIIGCENGAIYFVDSETNQLTEHCNYKIPVTFIKQLRSDLTLIGTNNCHYTILSAIQNKQFNENFVGCVVDAFLVYDIYVIVVLQNCKFDVINISTEEKSPVLLDYETDERSIRTCTLVDHILILGYQHYTLFWYDLNETKLEESVPEEINLEHDSEITCLTLTADKILAAVGYKNGDVDIFYLPPKFKHLISIKPSNVSINMMIFSPWTNMNTSPLILVVLSDQICFYDIRYYLQKSLRKSSSQVAIELRSQRLHGRRSFGDYKEANNKMPSSLILNSENLWANKIGPAGSVSLLACIKFIGNSAKRLFTDVNFNRFVTIDNEGNIHFLRLLDLANRNNDDDDAFI